jgi:hypothetical protein
MFLEVACVGVLALLFGLAVCFAGYRLFLMLLPIWGFFVGFAVGAGVVTALFGQGFLSTVTGWVSGFAVGLVFAVLSYFFYIVGVALFSGSVGYALGAGLVHLFFPNSLLIAFIVGIVGALIVIALTLALNLQKVVIVTVTAIGGASAVLTSVLLFLGRIQLADLGGNPVQPVLRDSIFWFIIWIVLAAIGFGSQIATTSSYELDTEGRTRAW